MKRLDISHNHLSGLQKCTCDNIITPCTFNGYSYPTLRIPRTHFYILRHFPLNIHSVASLTSFRIPFPLTFMSHRTCFPQKMIFFVLGLFLKQSHVNVRSCCTQGRGSFTLYTGDLKYQSCPYSEHSHLGFRICGHQFDFYAKFHLHFPGDIEASYSDLGDASMDLSNRIELIDWIPVGSCSCPMWFKGLCRNTICLLSWLMPLRAIHQNKSKKYSIKVLRLPT